MATPAADWPPLPRAAEVERGVTVSPARYMYGCARLSGIRGETLQRGEKRSTSDDEPETDRETARETDRQQRLGHLPRSRSLQRLQQPVCAQRIHTDSILHFIPSAAAPVRSGGRKKKKFGEMQSVYQHLLSLLFVFSSLHLHQLTEGCSCALTHPQDAFCNSDIGMYTARVDRFTARNQRVFYYYYYYHIYFSESTLG